jgi:hypothetical protein
VKVGDDTSSTASDSDLDNLPYPTPLQRNDFLAPDFSPATYLSTLSNRHQTLEDLRSELRSRSQLLSKELLDLVNSNYQDFLNLGNSLHGGEEKVEEVRVGLLGFRKEVEGLKRVVAEREDEVGVLLEKRRSVRGKIEVGRRVVELDERIRELEEDLEINGTGKAGREDEVSDSEEDEDDDDDDDESYGISLAKLRRNVMQYRLVQELEKSLREHPYVTAQAARMTRVRNTLLLDLSTALQQSKSAGAAGSARVMKVMKIYADMDESAEAVKVLKSLKTS